MKILISGSTGLIGEAVVSYLAKQGHTIVRLVRRPVQNKSKEIFWNPEKQEIDLQSLENFDVVLHLAGENVGGGRWSEAKKQAIKQSRLQGTTLLCDALLRLKNPPQAVLSASAIGYYGNRGAEILHEESSLGTGFFPQVAQAWESPLESLRERHIRIVNLRFGVVLSMRGGALTEMLPLFRKGLGAVLGSGKQYFSWIHIDDVVRAIDHVLKTRHIIRGPVNITAPYPVTNREFSKTLGQVLHRPVVLWTPGFALKILMGEMAEAMLLASLRVEPARLIATGFEFNYPELEGALRNLLSPS